MKKKLFKMGLAAVLLTTGLVFVGCPTSGSGGGGGGGDPDGNPFIGSWVGKTEFYNDDGIVFSSDNDEEIVFTSNGWKMLSQSWEGTYSRNGNNADLYDDLGEKAGTAKINGNTLTINGNDAYNFNGTFTKKPGSSDTGTGTGNNLFIGTWEGTLNITLVNEGVEQSQPDELEFTSNSWDMWYWSGTYERNGNNATMKINGANAGTATISGSTLTISMEYNGVRITSNNLKIKNSGGGSGGPSSTITDAATARALVQSINSMIDTICNYGITPKPGNDQTPYTITRNGTVSGSVYVEGPKYYGGYQEGWPSYGFKITSTNARLTLDFTNYANTSSLKIISGEGSYTYWKEYGGQQESGNYTLDGSFNFSYGGNLYGGTLSMKRSWKPESSYVYGTTIYSTVYTLEYLRVNGSLLLSSERL
ncbi:MAG: hypothetical protein FWG99_04475 [Treponema sp.]|nr:hypothetical protein [Treponema sp.]